MGNFQKKILILIKLIKKINNIFLITWAIILTRLLYYYFSPYQQCVREHVNMEFNSDWYEVRSSEERQKELDRLKAKDQVVCEVRRN